MSLIGIVQGRLSKSPKNRLQYFPKDWEKEFQVAKKLNFDFIEFFSERKFNSKNPIWIIKDIKRYKQLASNNKLKIINFCDDYIISNDIRKNQTIKYLKNLINKLCLLGVKNLILPMYGKSNLNNSNFTEFQNVLAKLLKFKKKINFLIESNIEIQSFIKLVNNIGSNRISFLFDTGNRVNLGYDMERDVINLNKLLSHVHIKDKNDQNQNVALGTGNVNFSKFFKSLKKINYTQHFTLETTRLDNPIKTAKKNIMFLKKKIKK